MIADAEGMTPPDNNDLGLMIMSLEMIVAEAFELIAASGACTKKQIAAMLRKHAEENRKFGMRESVIQPYEAIAGRLELGAPTGALALVPDTDPQID